MTEFVGPRTGTPIVLCADDFGISPSVSRAIVKLASAGRLSATSCMVTYPNSAEDIGAHDLTSTDVGLHFTMTQAPPVSSAAKNFFGERFPNSKEIFSLGLSRRLPYQVVVEELKAQYKLLRDSLGRPPDFLDGHHHIHQFPVVADVVAKFTTDHIKNSGPVYLRSTKESVPKILRRGVAATKALALSGLAGRLHRTAKANSIPVCSGFAGARDVTAESGFRNAFVRMLRAQTENTIVMCHPGTVDGLLAERDTMLKAREDELDYLSSSHLQEDLVRSDVRLSRFNFTR